MLTKYSVSLGKIIKEMSWETVYMPSEESLRPVRSIETNRPGLELAGFYDYFDNERIQVLGKSEVSYLETLAIDERLARVEQLVEKRPPALVVARAMPIPAAVDQCGYYLCHAGGVDRVPQRATGSPYHQSRRVCGSIRRGYFVGRRQRRR